MAPGGFRPRHSLCRYLSPGLGPAEDPYSGSISLALFCNSILGLALVPALIPTSALTPVPTDELFKQFMKAYLELNQGPRQPPAEREQLLKAKVSEVYYSKSHMDCYYFC